MQFPFRIGSDEENVLFSKQAIRHGLVESLIDRFGSKKDRGEKSVHAQASLAGAFESRRGELRIRVSAFFAADIGEHVLDEGAFANRGVFRIFEDRIGEGGITNRVITGARAKQGRILGVGREFVEEPGGGALGFRRAFLEESDGRSLGDDCFIGLVVLGDARDASFEVRGVAIFGATGGGNAHQEGLRRELGAGVRAVGGGSFRQEILLVVVLLQFGDEVFVGLGREMEVAVFGARALRGGVGKPSLDEACD